MKAAGAVRRHARFALVLLALAQAACAQRSAPEVRAPLAVPEAALLWNQPAVRAHCPDRAGYLWVQPSAGPACIRYFASGDIEGARVAIVQFSGDRDDEMDLAPTRIPGNTEALRTRDAQRSRDRAGVPWIFMARPGTYGSSGDHGRRRRLVEEFAPIDAALDALKRLHGIGQFVLVGHSGGATAAAAMLTLGRTDLRCVVMTSAAFAYEERVRLRREMAGEGPPSARALAAVQGMYDPLAHIGGVVRGDRRQVFVLGNALDNVTPFVLQRRFADALRNAGHRVAVREVQTLPPEYHDMQGQPGLETARDCAR
ncbi:alpha/beta fold hydrolase [Variovorax boronicumulans]|uniref:alpha/beta fold hydrolase n=1 Tax=Variovorax boronicumulans TaxID=436515 RepID=UPI001C598554